MQNGLKRMRTDPSVTNGNISDTIQDFPPVSGGVSGGTSGSERNGSLPSQKNHPLFSRGVCTWAGCEASCDSYVAFIAHLNREHILDERSTAQTRVQVRILIYVNQSW